MGVEQGDYFDYGPDDPGSYGYGGSVSDAFMIDYGAVNSESLPPDTSQERPIDWGFDTTQWPTLGEGGQLLSPDYAPGFGPESGYMDFGGGYVYDPSTGGVLDTGLQQPTSDLFGAYFDYYSAQGYSDEEAMQMAAEQAQAGAILTETLEKAPPPTLPDLPQDFFPLPYLPYDYWQSPPYVPTFPEGPPPPPPSGPATPLPGYCPRGTYHPANDPMACVPFPAAITSAPPRPQGGQPSPAPAPAPRPRPPATAPSTPTCSTGQVWDPVTRRCVLAATQPRPQAQTCPTYQIWDPRVNRCVTPSGMLPAPGEPSLGESTFADLKKLPIWVWLALAGLLILNFSGGDSRSTTVTYRRRT